MKKIKKITNMVMMGDSLSDRGTAAHRYVLGCIPMSWLSGLRGTSPQGSFTNGYVWSDVISSMFASDFLIANFKKKYGYTNEEIAHGVMTKEPRIMEPLQYSYNLDNHLNVTFNGKEFIRSYDEGGLSAYNYAWTPSTSITRFFSRIILSTLAEKRKKLLNYDTEHHVMKKEKAQTLIIEWSGANDLITVNARPSIAAADKAIKERIKNIETLIKKGYRHFVLFNLPDLSLVPRFQNMTGKEGERERENAQHCCNYFNEKLALACQKLQTIYPCFSIDVFDINEVFTKVYNDPSAYQFELNKLKKPFKDSPDFEKITDQKTSPAKGYMFWDDVHPTADMHALLANEFYKKYKQEYHFTEPDNGQIEKKMDISADELQKAFAVRYGEKLTKERRGFFGCARRSNIRYQTASLEEILRHGLLESGGRTRKVLCELQWIDKTGALNLNIPALSEAMDKIKAQATDGKRVAPLPPEIELYPLNQEKKTRVRVYSV